MPQAQTGGGGGGTSRPTTGGGRRSGAPVRSSIVKPTPWWEKLNELGTPSGIGGGGAPVPYIPPAGTTQSPTYMQPPKPPRPPTQVQSQSMAPASINQAPGAPNYPTQPSWWAKKNIPGRLAALGTPSGLGLEQQIPILPGNLGPTTPGAVNNNGGGGNGIDYSNFNVAPTPEELGISTLPTFQVVPPLVEEPPTSTSPFSTYYGTNWRRRGRGGGGGGYGGYGGASDYIPPYYLNLNSWNFGE